MEAPGPIIAMLECVVSLFLSNVRHNLRAAFVMCDELVELTCRERIRATLTKNKRLGKMDFRQLLENAAVGLSPTSQPLGKRLWDAHNYRNDIQHNNPAATVD